MPGSRTLLGSHPYWLGHDRVMADEFFRPVLHARRVGAAARSLPGLWYTAMLGNNISALGITATQLDARLRVRGLASGGCRPPTSSARTAAFDDWEYHEKVATRFGVSAVTQPARTASATARTERARQHDAPARRQPQPVRAPARSRRGVTVEKRDYWLLVARRGHQVPRRLPQAEYFQRWLDDFRADGPLPVSSIVDQGFYVQAAFYPVRTMLELYGATSWCSAIKSAGFDDARRYLAARTSSRRTRATSGSTRTSSTSTARPAAARSATTPAARRAPTVSTALVQSSSERRP